MNIHLTLNIHIHLTPDQEPQISVDSNVKTHNKNEEFNQRVSDFISRETPKEPTKPQQSRTLPPPEPKVEIQAPTEEEILAGLSELEEIE